MIKISSLLDVYLESIGEQVVTEAHLGSDKTEEYKLPTQVEVEYAAKNLVALMKVEEKNRTVILYGLLGLSLIWFILCACIIVYMVINNSGTVAISSVFGIDLIGLAMLLPFLHCIYQSKVKIDVFLAIFPSMGAKERAEISRLLFSNIEENGCDFGRKNNISNNKQST